MKRLMRDPVAIDSILADGARGRENSPAKP